MKSFFTVHEYCRTLYMILWLCRSICRCHTCRLCWNSL